jgi:PAS domain S-box-containing protein
MNNKNTRVLIVDDTPRLLLATSHVVHWGGHEIEVLEASTERKGHHRAATSALADLLLPDTRGNAIIAADDQGCVTFMNPTAQCLTGWEQTEAEGRSLDEVFFIINESTRQPVRCPLVDILYEGRIVRPANHTLLLDRYGSEIPIEVGGAPIKDDQDQVIGAALIFRECTARR